MEIAQILQELIPYLDSGIKKSEIIENIHYLFSPNFEFSYQMILEAYTNERIFNEIFDDYRRKGKIPTAIPINNPFLFTFRYIHLSQFYIM